MFVCLINLLPLRPRTNGGTARIAQEVTRMLLERAATDNRLQLVIVIREEFGHEFFEWVGTPLADHAPYVLLLHNLQEEVGWVESAVRPDLIISPQYGLIPFDDPQLFPGVPHVALMPDTLPLERPDLFPEDYEVRKKLFEDIKRAAKLVTISQFSRRQLSRYLDIDPEAIAVIYLGCDFSSTPIEKSPISSQIPQPYLIYPAHTWPHKRHDLLLAAFAKIRKQRPDLKLVLTGGRDLGSMSIPAFMERLKIPEGTVIDLGFVSESDLTWLYHNAEAMLFTSDYEGFGMPLLEAMHNGCPVICAHKSCIPEIVGDAAILVDSDEPGVWSKAFLEEMPAKRTWLIEQGYIHAEQFTWTKAREEWTQLLENFGLPQFRANSTRKPRLEYLRPYIMVPASNGPSGYFKTLEPSPIPLEKEVMADGLERLKMALHNWEAVRTAEQRNSFARSRILGYPIRLLTRLRNFNRLWTASLYFYDSLVEQQASFEARLNTLMHQQKMIDAGQKDNNQSQPENASR